MSMSIEPEMHDLLNAYKEKKKASSVSKVIRDLIEKYICLDDEVIPVIIKVPTNLTEDPDKLRDWLDSKSNAIHKALTKSCHENCLKS